MRGRAEGWGEGWWWALGTIGLALLVILTAAAIGLGIGAIFGEAGIGAAVGSFVGMFGWVAFGFYLSELDRKGKL